MDRRTVVGCNWVSRRRHYRPAEWHTRAADRCADCADNNDISSVSLSLFSVKWRKKNQMRRRFSSCCWLMWPKGFPSIYLASNKSCCWCEALLAKRGSLSRRYKVLFVYCQLSGMDEVRNWRSPGCEIPIPYRPSPCRKFSLLTRVGYCHFLQKFVKYIKLGFLGKYKKVWGCLNGFTLGS